MEENPINSSEIAREDGRWKPDAIKGECGQRTGAYTILGGEDALQGEFPFMALIGYHSLPNNDTIFYTCGGSVLNKKYILTAAHCHVVGNPQKEIREIVVGEHVVGQEKDCIRDRIGGKCLDVGLPPIQKFGVAKVILHENWNPSDFRQGFDIALVRIVKSIVLFYDDYMLSQVIPICLPWNDGDPTVENLRQKNPNQNLVITGWGKLTNNFSESLKSYQKYTVAARTLQKVTLPIHQQGMQENISKLTRSFIVLYWGIER